MGGKPDPASRSWFGGRLRIGGSVTLVTVRRLTLREGGRSDGCDQEGPRNLMRGLEALADGDLTVELHAEDRRRVEL